MAIQDSTLTRQEITKISSSSGYNSIYDDFVKFLKLSRKKSISNVELFDLQMEVAQKIITAEKNISYFKKAANRKNQNKEWFSREVHKAQRRAYKKLMDGVAWRLLKFDRVSLRQIAEHNRTGHIERGFIAEVSKAKDIVENSNFFVVFNDLTNFLRFGDLTVISEDKVLIDEIKLKGKAKGNQKEQLDLLLKRLNKKKFSIGDAVADFLSVPGKPSSFLPEVEKVMKDAKSSSKGIAASKVSPYLWVSCVYVDKILSFNKDFEKVKPFIPLSPFRGERESILIPTNNLFLFDTFTPNFAPYTIYPFNEELIADIILGKCILESHLSQRGLKKSIEGKGWGVVFPTREQLVDGYDSAQKPEDRIKEARNPEHNIRFMKDGFTNSLPRENLHRIDIEFLSAKSLVKQLEHAKSNYFGLGGKHFVTGFEKEEVLWV